MEIQIHNTYCELVGFNQAQLILAKNVLSYKDDNAHFINSAWNGVTCFLNKKNQFPTGLVHTLADEFKKARVSFKVLDKRIKPEKKYNFALNLPFTPRDYQGACRPLVGIKQRGVFLAGTGAGKSAMSAIVIDEIGLDTLAITPDLGLQKQLMASYIEFFGADKVGSKLSDKKPIIVANIQSIAKAEESEFLRFGCLIIDEFHHCFQGLTRISGPKSTNYKSKTIEEIYNLFHRGFKPKVTSWNGKEWESKNVINAMKYPAPEKMLKVKVQDEDGKIREFVVTKNHKFLTNNGKIEIGKMKVGDELSIGPEAKTLQEHLSKLNKSKNHRESVSLGNQNRSQEVRQKQSLKIKAKIVNGEYNPYGRGKFGNGNELTITQKEIVNLLNGEAEFIVAPKDKQRPYHYKIDVALPQYKLAIEVDGTSHKSRKEQDERKDARLGAIGWKVVRIPENSSKEELLKLKKLIHQMTSSMT